MKRRLLFTILASCFFIFSCSKSDSSPNNGINASNTIEYRITTGNAQNLNLSYNDKDQTTIGGIGTSGWVMNFTTTKKHFYSLFKRYSI